MIIAGLTGGSGSGKSSVGRFLEEYGFVHIDCDLVSRSVTAPGSDCLQELAEAFGSDILNTDGTLNRRLLAELVFPDKQKTLTLNQITHRAILAEVDRLVGESAARGACGVCVDGATLHESGYTAKCNCLIVVCAPRLRRIRAVMTRDGISRRAAIVRLRAQKKDSFYRRIADYVIYNRGTLDDLKKKTCAVAAQILAAEKTNA